MIDLKTRAVAPFSPDARTFHNIYKLQKHVVLKHQSYLIVFMGNKNLRFLQIMPLYVMRTLIITWALKEVGPINSVFMSGIAQKQIAFKFKIATHRKKYFDRKMDPLANGALCLSTPKHNGKSATSLTPKWAFFSYIMELE